MWCGRLHVSKEDIFGKNTAKMFLEKVKMIGNTPLFLLALTKTYFIGKATSNVLDQ